MKPDTYSVTIVWSDEDQAFVTEVSELPGCMAHGESSEQAIEQIGVALADGQLWNASHNGSSAIGTPSMIFRTESCGIASESNPPKLTP